MKKQIFLPEDLLKKIKFFSIIFFITSTFFTTKLFADEKWVLDKELSSIDFEIPVLLLENVRGSFLKKDGFIEFNTNQKKYKAIFTIDIESIEMNYKKYRNLIFSNIFFDLNNYSKALIDSKIFTYQNEKEISINAELTIKDETKIIPLNLKVNKLAEDLIQIKSEIIFSRTDFYIGIKKWSNTSILKDKVIVKINLFLFRE